MSLGEKDTSLILESLQEKGDYYTKYTVAEKKRLIDLQDAIIHITAETEKYRKMAKRVAIEVMNLHVLTPNPAYSRADGVTVGKDAQGVTMKVLIVLEAKLNKLLQRKSEVLNHNKQLKSDVNHFRRLRCQTDLQHSKYESVLSETKSYIERMLVESTAVVEERERLVEKRDALERINIEEQNIFQEEYEKMGVYIKGQNAALEHALLQERKQELLEKKKGIMHALGDDELRSGQFTLAEEIEMAKQVGTLTNFVLSEENSLSGIQTKINNYEMMFEQLKKLTSTSSLEEVISSYVSQEEEMFSLYNFIQAVNTEIDTVLESSSHIEQAISTYNEEQQMQDDQRRDVIFDLQEKLTEVHEHIKQSETDNKMYQESVAQVSKKVSSLFFKLQCDQMDSKAGTSVPPGSGGGGKGTTGSGKASVSSGSGGGGGGRPEGKIAILTAQGVSESNVLDYMGCIEQRAVDIISEYLRNAPDVVGTPGAGGVPVSVPYMHRSPTPGPKSPMVWPNEPMVDLADDKDIDDIVFMGDDRGDTGAGVFLTNGSSAANAGGNGKGGGGGLTVAGDSNNDSDSKPVDLNAFKEKLQKKLGLTQPRDSKEFVLQKPGSRK